MQRADHERLIEKLRRGERMTAAPFEVPADRCRSAEQLARERRLFARPRVATVSSAIAPGGVLPFDEPGFSALLVRDEHGVLRAFTNACRHRGTRLVDAPCSGKAMVCPYH